MPQLRFTVRDGDTFEVWPKGTYNVRIIKIDQGVSKEKNNPQLKFTLEVLDGPYEGKKKVWFVTITDKSGFDLGRILEAAVPGEYEAVQADNDSEGNKRMTYEFDSDLLLDRVMTVDCSIREYNGQDQNQFSKARAFLPEGQAQPSTDQGQGAQASQVQAGELQAAQDAGVQERTASSRRRVSNA